MIMLKYGVIGTNWITDWWIASAQATGQWQLAAVYSRTTERAQAFASKYNVTTTYTSLTDLVNDPSLDAIYIASPNSLHYQHAKLVLSAKKHAVLEKPSTATVAQLTALFALARANSVLLIEAYRHLHEANFHALRAALPRLGRVHGASLTFSSFSSRYRNVLAGERPNIFTLDLAGGSLVDLGVYPISAAVALFGRPKAQSYAPFIAPTGVDGGGFVVLTYDGFTVHVNQSKVWTSKAPSEIYGEKGTLRVNGITDIETVAFWSNATGETEELGGSKAERNMMEEAAEIGRIIVERDGDAAAALERLSLDVLAVTTDLRQQNGIVFPADSEDL